MNRGEMEHSKMSRGDMDHSAPQHETAGGE